MEGPYCFLLIGCRAHTDTHTQTHRQYTNSTGFRAKAKGKTGKRIINYYHHQQSGRYCHQFSHTIGSDWHKHTPDFWVEKPRFMFHADTSLHFFFFQYTDNKGNKFTQNISPFRTPSWLKCIRMSVPTWQGVVCPEPLQIREINFSRCSFHVHRDGRHRRGMPYGCFASHF